MLLDIHGGTSLLGDALFMVAVSLKASLSLGSDRLKRRRVSHLINLNAPEGRLHIDGVTYYG